MLRPFLLLGAAAAALATGCAAGGAAFAPLQPLSRGATLLEQASAGCYRIVPSGSWGASAPADTMRLDTLPGRGGYGRRGLAVSPGAFRGAYWRRPSGDTLRIHWTMSASPDGDLGMGGLWDETVATLAVRGDTLAGTLRTTRDLESGGAPTPVRAYRVECATH